MTGNTQSCVSGSGDMEGSSEKSKTVKPKTDLSMWEPIIQQRQHSKNCRKRSFKGAKIISCTSYFTSKTWI